MCLYPGRHPMAAWQVPAVVGIEEEMGILAVTGDSNAKVGANACRQWAADCWRFGETNDQCLRLLAFAQSQIDCWRQSTPRQKKKKPWWLTWSTLDRMCTGHMIGMFDIFHYVSPVLSVPDKEWEDENDKSVDIWQLLSSAPHKFCFLVWNTFLHIYLSYSRGLGILIALIATASADVH